MQQSTAGGSSWRNFQWRPKISPRGGLSCRSTSGSSCHIPTHSLGTRQLWKSRSGQSCAAGFRQSLTVKKRFLHLLQIDLRSCAGAVRQARQVGWHTLRQEHKVVPHMSPLLPQDAENALPNAIDGVRWTAGARWRALTAIRARQVRSRQAARDRAGRATTPFRKWPGRHPW